MSVRVKILLKNKKFRSVYSLAVFCCILTSSCTSRWEKVYQLGVKSLENKDYFRAVTLFEKSFEELKLDSKECTQFCFQLSGEIAQTYLSRIKNPLLALEWFKIQRFYVPSENELIQLQKQIIRLFIDYLNDHQMAAVEAYKLLNFNLNLQDFCEVVFSLSWSLFELRDKQGALREISQCLGNIPIPETLQFNLSKLEVDILMSEKNYDQVTDKLKILIDRYDHLDKEGGLRLLLALAYEEKGLFAKAHEVLDEILSRDQKEHRYIQLRKERLNFKEKNQAGAKLKKKKQ